MTGMRPSRLTASSCLRAALGLALVGLLMMPAPARAGDDENAPEDVPIDTQIFRSIMSSLGLKRADEADINYGERPPLVIPSDQSLPPPEKTDAAVKNPAWPKDPDVARAKLRKKLEAKGTSSEEVEHQSHPLRPNELTPGAKDVPRTRPQQTLADPAGANGQTMSPSQLGYSGGLFGKLFGKDSKEADSAQFTGERPRADLTQPPPGYQTPSPDQPYGKKGGAPKASNDYATRGEYNGDK